MDHSVGSQIMGLLQTHHLLTASELVQKLHEQGRQVNKTSVYRALDKLLAENTVCRQNLKQNELVYELRDHHHDHLVCLNCGKISTSDCQIETTQLPEDFTVDHHHLTIFGTCKDCSLKNNESKQGMSA